MGTFSARAQAPGGTKGRASTTMQQSKCYHCSLSSCSFYTSLNIVELSNKNSFCSVIEMGGFAQKHKALLPTFEDENDDNSESKIDVGVDVD